MNYIIKYEALDRRFEFDKWYLMFMRTPWTRKFTAETLKERNNTPISEGNEKAKVTKAEVLR